LVRPATELAAAAAAYVPVRVTDMRGIDLNVYRFNYDLTLAVLLMHPDGTLYTTYAGRDASDASSHQSTTSLARVLRETLAVHQRYSRSPAPPPHRPAKTVESLPWFQRHKHDKCFHCHNVHDAYQWEGRMRKTWTERDQYTWPDPDQVGLRLDREGQVVVAGVREGSPAADAGLRKGDRIDSINGRATHAFGDVQAALNDVAWGKAEVSIGITRDNDKHGAVLALPESWKRPTPEQYAWRAMKWSMPPMPGFGGPPLSADERRAAGLAPDNFAFRVGYLVTWGPNRATGENARKAGIRKGMVVHEIDGKTDFRDMNHFHAWFRMTRAPGRPVKIGVIHNGTRRTLTLTPLR
jgi:hypothetical protein